MNILELLPQLLTLGTRLITNILQRRQARASLDQGQKLRAALAQSDANTKIYDEIVSEATQQINEKNVAINSDLAQLDTLTAQIKALAKD